MGSIESSDFYGVDDLLTAEEKEMRDRVRAFVESECMPIISDYFEKGTFPLQIIPRMAELGLFGVHGMDTAAPSI